MMTSPEFRVLGGLVLAANGQQVPLGGPKPQCLLSVLLADRHGSVGPDRLAEALWPDHPPASGAATIQSYVSRVRSLLPKGFAIELDPGGYRLETPEDGVDALRFSVMVDHSRGLPAELAVPMLESALALWTGPAFGRYADLPDVRPEALRLEELRLVATEEWAEKKLDTSDPATMVGELEAHAAQHPLRESYRRLLMVALHRTGRQGEALRHASEFRRMLRDDMGLDVSPAMQALESTILANEAADLPTERHPPQRVQGALAPELLGATSFVGRDQDLATLTKAVREHAVVTVTGSGGVGKTRLAMRVAGELVEQFSNGVTVVQFAPLRDPSGVAQVLAHALDIQQRQYRTIESTIEDHLLTMNSLLLFDNCEHVIDMIAPLVDRLRSACPQLRMLATSREPLGLPGEFVEVIGPLGVPAPEAVTPEEIRRSAAVELFVSRARASARGFSLTEDNAPNVAEVCRRVDGLPLAIELAAARLRTMGVEVLAERLSQRSELLGQTQRGADGRHRTLHELVAWSHDLLEPDEQTVFEQLAVFAGGFDLAAAEAVCTVDGDATPTLGTLASLVDKSMVVFVDPGPPRYRLLEPLREFGLDRLRHRDALSAVEERHLRWFVYLAERGSDELDGPNESKWSIALSRDLENFRAAHLCALRRNDVDSALRLVASLREFAFRRVVYEIESWADAAAALDGARDHPGHDMALAVSAYGRFVRGDREAATALAFEALDGADALARNLAERVLGNCFFYVEQVEEGLAWMDRMYESARTAGSDASVAHGLYMRSVAQTSLGNGIRGAVLAGEAKAVGNSVGSPTARAQADYALGLALENTDGAEALACLERASAAAAAAGNRWIEAFALTEVHWMRAKRGDHEEALIGYADVIDTWYRGGDWANQWLSLRRVLGILLDVGALQPAAVLHGYLAAVGVSDALPFVPQDADELTENVAQLRSQLGPGEFADAVRRGSRMKDAEVVTFVKRLITQLTTEGAQTIPMR